MAHNRQEDEQPDFMSVEKPPLSRIEYQRLKMIKRLLEARKDDPSLEIYAVDKALFRNRRKLGLDYKPNFSPCLASEEAMEKSFALQRPDTLNEMAAKQAATLAVIDARLEELKQQKITFEASDLERNVHVLAQALNLNQTQYQLLNFFACADKGNYYNVLQAAYPSKNITHDDYVESVGLLLGITDKEALKKELDPDSVLLGVNFLAQDKKTYECSVDAPLQRILAKHYKNKDDLLTGMLGPAPKTELKPADYRYMAQDLEDMKLTLKGYIKDPRTNVRKNMTLGGPPGTGKTQITAILSKELDVPAFLVGVARKSETTGYSLDEPTRDERIKALVRAAFVIRQTGMKAILVFDEAEDILRDLNSPDNKDVGSKAFINEMLENLGVPVIFISNRTNLFDPATTRRNLPYFGMNYMPFEARVGTIIEKTKKYLGVALKPEDVKELSALAEHLSVAVIDSCISITGKREPDPFNTRTLVNEIKREFERALRAQNGGISPVPLKPSFESKKFDPLLISANEDIAGMQKRFTKDPAKLAGKDIVLLGRPGSGRTTNAQYLASVGGMDATIVAMNDHVIQNHPRSAHADDIEASHLDKKPIIFNGALRFLLNSQNHPLLERVRAHSQPTFFVADETDQLSQQELEQKLSHMTFVMRTGNLSPSQLIKASKDLLGIELDPQDVRAKKVNIGELLIVKKQLEALGQEGDKDELLSRLETVGHRLNLPDKANIGFAEQAAAIPRRAGRGGPG